MFGPWEVGSNQKGPGGYPPGLLILRRPAPHTPSQNPTARLASSTTLTQQAREAPRNPLGEIQSPDLLILRTFHHRKEEKIRRVSTFQLTIPLHRGGTSQRLAARQLFLPSDFRHCRPTLVTGHHSQLSSVHSHPKKLSHNAQLCMATLVLTPDTGAPATEVNFQGPPWRSEAAAPSGYPGDPVRPGIASSLCWWRRTPGLGFLSESFKGPLS